MGERLGRYQLIRSLATGGMGEIYLAEHTGIAGFAKRVALKRIRPSLAQDPSYVQLFLNEARIGSFLNHPNIVHIFDVGHENDELWLVMEYVDGVDLKRLQRRSNLAGHPLPPPMIASIAVEVLSALEEAHSGGPTHGEPIIHRDMSPENILIARSGAVKVLDFGLAKWSPGRRSVPSLEGRVIFGKVRYMPPEQLRGQLIDVRADLFALGVVMYEALVGDLPFGSGDSNQVLQRILSGPPPSPTAARFGQDNAIDAVIQRAIAEDPNDRFQSATEMRSALVDILETRHRTVLPFEGLRKILSPCEPPAVPVATRAPVRRELDDDDDDDDVSSPTRIGLSVVERCGKCGGPFSALFLNGLIVDRCSDCRGVWLDLGEVERIIGTAARSTPESKVGLMNRAPLDRIVGSCPTCRIGLLALEVPERPASIELCPRCLGVWFDHGEISLLRDAAVVSWLGERLREARRRNGETAGN